MSGILDSKQRIFDTVLTPEGRKQLAEGNLRAVFYSFTDSAAIYTEDTIVSGSGSTGQDVFDATYRFTLESTGLPQDSIVFEADDSGKLIGTPTSGSEKYVIVGGQIFSGSKEHQRIHITGSQFNSLSKILLSSSINAFQNQMILRSPDPIDEKDREFLLDSQTIDFNITKNRPFKSGEISTANINHIEGFFQDKRLSSIPNFQFLPPVNKPRVGETERRRIGNYLSLNQQSIETFEELEKELEEFEQNEIRFTESSRENNLVCQFFEVSQDKMIKLDVIDFGTFKTQDRTLKHVFFAGKIFIDDYNCPTFVNMFTIIFEND